MNPSQLAPFAGAGDGFSGFAVGGAAAFGFAFVPKLLAFSEGEFHFYPAVFEVQAGRDESKPLLLRLAD